MLDHIVDGVRKTVRSLLRSPGHFAVSVAALALGIGAVTAVFAVASAVYLEPLPYTDADRLVMVWEARRGENEHHTVAPAVLRDWMERQSSFEALTASNLATATLTGEGDAVRLPASIVLPDFFDVFGVGALHGRTFRSEDVDGGGGDAVVLSHAFWRSRYGADPGVVGRSVRLDGRPHTVVGVMPEGFEHPEPFEEAVRPLLWRPISLAALSDDRSSRFLHVAGRLRSGVELEAARREMIAIAAEIEEISPSTHRGWTARVVPLRDELFGDVGPGLRLLLFGTGFVLLIVAVNVANLMLARNQRRTHEFAVRAAIGAGRAVLARQVLFEAVVVAVAGGLAGTLLVLLGGGVLEAIQSRHLAQAPEIGVDPGVVAFTVAVSLLTALGFGLLPALRSARPDLRRALTTGRVGAGRGARRSRRVLIVAQIALTVVLLVSAGLLGRSFLSLTHTDVGFESESILTLDVVLPSGTYGDATRTASALDDLVGRIETVPGVEAAAVTSDLPFTGWNLTTEVVPPDRVPAEGELVPEFEYRTVSEKYFGVLGLRVLEGEARVDAPAAAEGVHAVVVNEALARELWPGRSAVGRRVRVGSVERGFEAVVSGVVGDVLDDGFESRAEPRVYRSHRSRANRWVFFVMRTTVDPRTVVPAVRREIAAYDPEIPVTDLRPLADVVDATVAGRRFTLQLVLVFGGLTLVLAAIGIYGVLSYDMSERRREIGLRVALGARSGEVARLVVRDSLLLAGVGLLLGAGLSLAAARLLGGLLHGVGAADPASLALATLAMGATAAAAALVPARRAAAVDPMEVLRGE